MVQRGVTQASIPARSARKDMEKVMTDFQFRKIIQMVLAILERSKDLQDAVEQIKNLLKKEEE